MLVSVFVCECQCKCEGGWGGSGGRESIGEWKFESFYNMDNHMEKIDEKVLKELAMKTLKYHYR